MRYKTFCLAAGGYLWLTVSTVIAGAHYPGYDHVGRFISELGAQGAPHGQAFSWLGFLPAGLLLVLFAVLAIRSLPLNAITILGFGMFGFYAFGLIWSTFFPCDFMCRPDRPSVSHVLHVSVGMLGYVAGALSAFMVASGSGAWTRSRTIPVLCVICGVNALLALGLIDTDNPYAGLAQRSLEISMAIWSIACALSIDRFINSKSEVHSTTPA